MFVKIVSLTVKLPCNHVLSFLSPGYQLGVVLLNCKKVGWVAIGPGFGGITLKSIYEYVLLPLAFKPVIRLFEVFLEVIFDVRIVGTFNVLPILAFLSTINEYCGFDDILPILTLPIIFTKPAFVALISFPFAFDANKYVLDNGDDINEGVIVILVVFTSLDFTVFAIFID